MRFDFFELRALKLVETVGIDIFFTEMSKSSPVPPFAVLPDFGEQSLVEPTTFLFPNIVRNWKRTVTSLLQEEHCKRAVK
jgi:hypothetical protein